MKKSIIEKSILYSLALITLVKYPLLFIFVWWGLFVIIANVDTFNSYLQSKIDKFLSKESFWRSIITIQLRNPFVMKKTEEVEVDKETI